VSGTYQALHQTELWLPGLDQDGSELEDLRLRVVREPRGLEVHHGERPHGRRERLEHPEINPELLAGALLDPSQT
jgi:hypothetical protein